MNIEQRKDLQEYIAVALQRIKELPETTDKDALYFATKARFPDDVRAEILRAIKLGRLPRKTASQIARDKKKPKGLESLTN